MPLYMLTQKISYHIRPQII